MPTPMPILKSEVYKLSPKFLKDGTFGNVYRTGYRMRFSRTELAYKEYKASAPNLGQRGETVTNTVVFRNSRSQKDLEILNRYFAWPCELVMDNATSEICGFLMPLADPEFSWDKGKVTGQLRTLDWLAAPESLLQANGVAEDMTVVTAADRLFLMTQLTSAVNWLHKSGWVFGDLSFNNVAFALPFEQRQSRLMIIDCDDAAAFANKRRSLQPHSPNWLPPECVTDPQRQQDFETDVYKLGLAIIRCLKPEPGALSTKDISRLAGIIDTEGIALLTRALSPNRGERPSAEELLKYLEGASTELMVAPTIIDAELISPLVLLGANAQITWHLKDAQEIRVFVGGEGPQHLVRRGAPADYPDGCSFPVTLPGQVTVVATNRYGPTKRIIGNVAPYVLPEFHLDLGKLPPLNVPSSPDFTMKPFPPRPAEPPGPPDIPPIKQLEFAELLSRFAPGGTIASPGAHINTVLDSSRSLMDLIHAETERFSSLLKRKDMGNSHG